MATIKRVAYAFNSALEDAGEPCYFLDCFIAKDGEMLVDTHGVFKSREEFMDAIAGVIPVIEEMQEDIDGEEFQR